MGNYPVTQNFRRNFQKTWLAACADGSKGLPKIFANSLSSQPGSAVL